MILDVRSPGVVRLHEATDFARFKVVVASDERDPATVQANLSGIAHVALDAGHAFVAPAAIRALAGALARDDRWCASFESMVALAAEKGWSDSDGRICAHIEPTNAACD